MNSVVLGLLKIGATLLVISIGIMIFGASLLLLIISLPFPGLRDFVPDIGAFVDTLGWALRGILFDKFGQDEFRSGEVQDEWSDTLDRPRAHEIYQTVIPWSGTTHMYTEPYPYAPYPEKPKPHHTFHHEPQTQLVYFPPYPKEPENPNYAPPNKELKKEPHDDHNGPEIKKPHDYRPYMPLPMSLPMSGLPYHGGYCGIPNRQPQFCDTFNKIVSFDLTDQAGDSD